MHPMRQSSGTVCGSVTVGQAHVIITEQDGGDSKTTDPEDPRGSNEA